MSDVYKIIKLKDNHVLKIEHDSFTDSPREWDNLGTVIVFHKNYDFGDATNLNSSMFEGWCGLKDHLVNELNAKICLPIYMYDHSGITISTSPFSCKWDSGQVGYIYVTNTRIIEEYGDDSEDSIKNATSVLEGEIKTLDQYLTGDVYSFTLVKEITCDLGHTHEEVIDSCGGFYGSDEKTNGIMEHIDKKLIIEE